MGIIREPVTIGGKLQETMLLAIFDTGADYSVIRYQLSNGQTIDEIGVREYLPESVSILLPGETEKSDACYYDYAIFNWVEIAGVRIRNPGFVILEIGDDVLVGHEFMQNIGLQLDMKNHNVKQNGTRSTN